MHLDWFWYGRKMADYACVDYCGINKNIVPDQYPIPRVDDLIDAVGRQQGKFFTSLDNYNERLS